MIAAGYTTHLYCDDKRACGRKYPNARCFEEFYGQTWAETARQAKRAGWTISKDHATVVCPQCNAAKKAKP